MVSKQQPHDTSKVGTHLLPRIRESHPLTNLLHLCPDSLLNYEGSQDRGKALPISKWKGPQVHTQVWHLTVGQCQARTGPDRFSED